MQDRIFRALLRLLPRDVRDAYARDMETTFRTERQEAGGGARGLRLLLATAVDVLRSAPSHHWDIFSRDLRFAWRTLLSRPLHFISAAGTLALGLGAAIAMFAVINAVLLNPLPYRDANRLVTVQETQRGGNASNIGYLTFVDLRDRARSVQYVSASTLSIGTLTGDGRDAERVNIMRTSSSYFQMIGVRTAEGRLFTEAEDRPGTARRVTILSDKLWRRRFGGDRSVLNRTIEVNRIPFTVVGIMPAGFEDMVASQLYENAEMWTPLGYDPAASFACRTCRHLRVFAKLNDGVSPAQAEQDLGGIIRAAEQEHPKEYDGSGIKIVRLSDLFLGPVRPVLLILSAGVVLLLLVACGNVANLLLIRATEREQELAVRTALGVTTSRLVRQLMTESLLLAFTGTFIGLPIAVLAIRFVVAVGPATLPRLANASLDARTIAAAVSMAVATGLLFGLAPVWQLRRRRLTVGLKDGLRRTANVQTWRLRALLVAANMAMAAVLIVSSGLVVRSLLGLLAVKTGFDPDRTLTLRVSLSGPQYATPDNAKNITATVAYYDQLLGKVRSLPGVESAAGVTTLPLSGQVDGFGIHIVGRPEPNPEASPSGDRFAVTPDYFKTMKIPLKSGRFIEETDRQTTPMVVVINETLAREQFPDGNAIGQSLRIGAIEGPPRTIVGIVGDVKHLKLEGRQTYQTYVSQSQWAWAETEMTLVVRTAGEPLALTESIRQAAREIDPAQPITHVSAYSEIVQKAAGSRRIAAQLLSAFAVVALILATIGLYGALGVLAGQRRQEIGVRMALGAAGGEIGRLLLAQGLRPALAGLAAGFGIAALAGGVLESLLYGITGLDPATFAMSAGVLVAAALMACAIPARRASRVNPALALRAE